MKKTKKMLLEAINSFLNEEMDVGVSSSDVDETSHTQWFQWENINDMYRMEISNSAFYESISSAFYMVHSLKYLEDPSFGKLFISEMKNRAVPSDQMNLAFEALKKVIKDQNGEFPEYLKDYGNMVAEISTENGSIPRKWSERDAGWNPNIDEINNMTRNADNYKGKSEPFTGGGPAPKENTLGNYSDLK